MGRPASFAALRQRRAPNAVSAPKPPVSTQGLTDDDGKAHARKPVFGAERPMQDAPAKRLLNPVLNPAPRPHSFAALKQRRSLPAYVPPVRDTGAKPLPIQEAQGDVAGIYGPQTVGAQPVVGLIMNPHAKGLLHAMRPVDEEPEMREIKRTKRLERF